MTRRQDVARFAFVGALVGLTVGAAASAYWILTDTPAPIPEVTEAGYESDRLGISIGDGITADMIAIDSLEIGAIAAGTSPQDPWSVTYLVTFRSKEQAVQGELVAWVPVGAAQVGGWVRTGDEQIEITPEMDITTGGGRAVHLPVSATRDSTGLTAVVSFSWMNPNVRALGHDRSEIQIGVGTGSRPYQSITKAFQASDFVGWASFGFEGENDVWQSAIPHPDHGAFAAWAWDIDEPDGYLDIAGVAEDAWMRRQVELVGNLFFLLLGTFIGALLPVLQSAAKVRRGAAARPSA